MNDFYHVLMDSLVLVVLTTFTHVAPVGLGSLELAKADFGSLSMRGLSQNNQIRKLQSSIQIPFRSVSTPS